MPLANWLPDFKGALNGFYDERLKAVIDNKSTEYKDLLQESLAKWNNTQNILIVIALAIFVLLLIAYFWKD